MLRINIVYDNRDGCIYSKFLTMFYKHSRHQILTNCSEVCDIVHYLPSYKSPDDPAPRNTIWVSHQDSQNIDEKFVLAAKNANFVFSHSKKYLELLKGQGIERIGQVMPGVDLCKFILRSSERHSSKNKLIIGYVGRQYNPSERKNPKLLQKIASLPFVDLRSTGGLVKEQNLPKFYASLDAIISPATIEGGPMSIIEGFAVGVPTICFESVGIANEFDKGILRVEFGNDDAFIDRLEALWKDKEYLEYRNADFMKTLRNQVECFTWENFVAEHDKIWEELCQ